MTDDIDVKNARIVIEDGKATIAVLEGVAASDIPLTISAALASAVAAWCYSQPEPHGAVALFGALFTESVAELNAEWLEAGSEVA